MELDPRGIRVNVIAPGLIDTPLTAMLTQPSLKDEFLDNIPPGRIGAPADVAAALSWPQTTQPGSPAACRWSAAAGTPKRYPELARRFAGQDR